MLRPPLSAYLVLAWGIATPVWAQTGSASHPSTVHGPRSAEARTAGKTAATPMSLSHNVHIAPSAMKPGSTSIETGSDTWNARGYDLKTLLSQIYGVEALQIELPDGVDPEARYDLTASLPAEVDADEMKALLTDALQKKFGLTIAPESRAMEVYVLTAPAGPGSQLHRHAGAQGQGQIQYLGKECAGVSSGGIEASASTIADFGKSLEASLDHVLVDETRLAGSYDFKIPNYNNKDELFKALHDQLGLVVTPAQRNVTVVTARAVEGLRAKM
jgi:uncharacterized protein (TIGR03435 family)